MSSQQTATIAASAFATDVLQGLNEQPKRLPSRYFYNAAGDKLFQQIMQLPEYYPTRCEFEVLSEHTAALMKQFAHTGKPFTLVEFGAGDGTKTKVLLRHFVQQNIDFTYAPVDISGNVLKQLQQALHQELPQLNVAPLNAEYFKALEQLEETTKGQPKVVLFMGANIGNFEPEQAADFLKKMRSFFNQEDRLLIGFDLKKNPEVILAAYNDSAGVTRAFNLNLLQRMNDELGANFQLNQFKHYPTYNPLTGDTRSFLISDRQQKVHFEALDETIEFYQWEPIGMELSKKYSIVDVEQLAEQTGFEVARHYLDCKHYFTSSLWVPK